MDPKGGPQYFKVFEARFFSGAQLGRSRIWRIIFTCVYFIDHRSDLLQNFRMKYIQYFALVIAMMDPLVALPQDKNESSSLSLSPFGIYEGTGRACSGRLSIFKDNVAWTSTWSVCKKSTYKIIEHQTSEAKLSFVVQLNRTSRQCKYSVLELEHDNSQSADTGWQIIGFSSVVDFKKKNFSNALSCYLVQKSSSH